MAYFHPLYSCKYLSGVSSNPDVRAAAKIVRLEHAWKAAEDEAAERHMAQLWAHELAMKEQKTRSTLSSRFTFLESASGAENLVTSRYLASVPGNPC